jgi:hypothetical protein
LKISNNEELRQSEIANKIIENFKAYLKELIEDFSPTDIPEENLPNQLTFKSKMLNPHERHTNSIDVLEKGSLIQLKDGIKYTIQDIQNNWIRLRPQKTKDFQETEDVYVSKNELIYLLDLHDGIQNPLLGKFPNNFNDKGEALLEIVIFPDADDDNDRLKNLRIAIAEQITNRLLKETSFNSNVIDPNNLN